MRQVIGREHEMEVVGQFLDELASGTAALLLAGEPGIGKTTIWRAAAGQAAERGHRVLTARPTQAEAQLPLAGLYDLVAALLDNFGGRLAAPLRRALEVALLRAPPDDSPVESLALALATLELLRVAAQAQPLVVAIDDVPWLDASSVAVLEFAARRLEAERIGFVLAQRTTADRSLPPVARVVGEARLRRLHVEPLSSTDIERLLADRLQLRLAPGPSARLYHASSGNPFFALEIGAAFRRTTRSDGLMPLPDSLADLVRDRLQGLSPAARSVVLHAAALSQPRRALLTAALGRDATVAGLEEARVAGVLREEDEEVHFAHPLLAAAAYDSVDDAGRRSAHHRLAGVVAEQEERARHLALGSATPNEVVAAELERAAEVARARGATEAAAQLATQSVRFTPVRDDEAAQRRLLAAARYMVLAGDVAQARQSLEERLLHVSEGPPRAAILLQLAEARHLADDWDEARALLKQALPHAASDVRLAIRIKLLLAGVGYVTEQEWDAAAVHATEAWRLADDLGDEETLATTIGAFITWQFATGHGLSRHLLERAEQLKPWTRRLRTMDTPDFAIANVMEAEGDRRGFAERYEQLVKHAQDVGDYSSLPFILGNLGGSNHADPVTGLQLIARGEHIARATRQRTALAAVLCAKTEVLARLGQAAEAWETGAEALQAAAETGWRQGEWEATSILALLELSRGRADRAHELLTTLLAGRAARHGTEPSRRYGVTGTLAEALVALGRPADASLVLTELEDRAQSLGRPIAIAAALRARGLIRAAQGAASEGAEALAKSAAMFAELDQSWEQARSLLALGEVQRRARRRADANRALAAAHAIFVELGAVLWAGRARRERARGGSRTRRPGAMTGTQREVARLVSDGRTNREVADALFMSIHTVETHLTAVYRLLGVRNRAELVRAFRDSAAVASDPDPRPG